MSEHNSWWLDELAYAGAEHLDPAYVAGYDAKAQVDPEPDVATLTAYGLDASSIVVEFGAGTGVFAAAAADRGASVVALDVAPAMIEALNKRAAQQITGTIRVAQAGFLSYEHRGPNPNFIYTRNALHQLPDLWKVVALGRMVDLLVPGGILLLRDLVFDLEPNEFESGIDQWMAGAVTDRSKGYTASEFADHVQTEFSTYTWLFEPMIRRTGLEILDAKVDRSVYAAYVCQKPRGATGSK